MPEYLSPGVYVEEVDSGTKPIESVGTSTAGFVGYSKKGPINSPVYVTNWSQFAKTFGDFNDSFYLAHAVYGFFNNGGSKCFVTNVGLEQESDKKKEVEAKDIISIEKGIDPRVFIGEDKGPGARTGLKTFEDIDEISIVSAPGQTDPAVQDALLSHCELLRDRFAILDSQEEITGGVDSILKPRDSKYGAYYFPWIQTNNPILGNVFVPPAGHLSGIYASTDTQRGVHKAPANEIVKGALGLRYKITKGEQDLLNPKGINCIREMPNAGIRVWGARTISSDASWRYVNVRRLFIMVEKTIERGTQWVVFEPNNQALWKKVTRNISAFLMRIWRDGALFGSTPEEAFYIKCDAETNPPEVVDAGQLIVEVGIAPVKPAEFVIFRIAQKAYGAEE